MKQWYSVLILCLLPLLVFANPDITRLELDRHIRFLAADSMEGRRAGTAFADKAALYIKSQLVLDGSDFLADDGYQTFEIVTDLKLGGGNMLSLGDVQLEPETDFIPLPFSENDTLQADAVWLGYGLDIDTDTLKWNDYTVDVNGKWAVMLLGDPELQNPKSPFAMHSIPRKKVMVARDHGAVGVVFVSGPEYDKQDKLPDLTIRDSHVTAGLPVVQVKRAMLDSVLTQQRESVAELETHYNENRLPTSFGLEFPIAARVNIRRVQKPTHNVVAVLPGSDPEKRDDYLVIGAHYDHLGWGGPGSGSRSPDTTAIHNGADDNGSGVSAILEIYEKMATAPTPPKRSILFIAFGAEEIGSLGSNYFVDHPLVGLENIKYMFNFDMVGRLSENRELTLNGTGTAAGIPDLINSVAEPYDFNLQLSPAGFGPSDHAPFYSNKIPVLMFFTDVHDDYHTPADDIEKINFEGLLDVTRFAHDMIRAIADLDTLPAFQKAGPTSRPARRRMKVTLGIVPDHAAADIKGLRVSGVIDDRPASQAGMEKGDVIVEIQGKDVENIYDYMYRLGELEPGQEITVKVLRNDKPKFLIVQL